MNNVLTYDELLTKLESLQKEKELLQSKLLQKQGKTAGKDITESELNQNIYHAELINALQQSEERYQKIIDFAPCPLFIAKNEIIEFANQSALRLFGVTHAGEVTGKSVYQFIHPESWNAILQTTPYTAKESHFSRREEKIIRLNGETRLVELEAVQYQEKENSFIHVYLKDITAERKTEKFNDALKEIEKIIYNSLDQHEIVERTMRRAAIVAECDSAAVSFLHNRKWTVKYVHGFEESIVGLTMEENDEPHAVLALKTKSPVFINDTATDPRVNNEMLKKWGIESVLVVPLFTRHKKIGVIFFNYSRQKHISPEKIKFVTSLSYSLSLALENCRLYENVLNELKTRRQKELELDKINLSQKALAKSSQAMLHAQDEMTYAREVCRIVVEDFGFSMVSVNYIENDPDKSIRPFAWSGLESGYMRNLKMSWGDNPYGHGPSGKAVCTGKLSVCNNILTDPAFEPWREEGIRSGYMSAIALPLINDKKVFGTLNVYAAEPDSFSRFEIKFLSELAKDLSNGVTTIRLREAAQKTFRALTESEEKFRMLTEKSNALICELDLSGKILYANSKFSEHLGYEPNELEGHSISEACLPEMQQNFLNCIVHFFPNPAFKNEWYLKDKKGLWHWFRCHTSAFVNAKGEERRSVILFDINDIKQAEEQLKKYTRDLKALNATKDKFFGIIAHDLKNPFTSLLGASELLINSLENFDPETVRHIGTLLYDSAKRGYALLQNLLEWSRSQSGTITFNPQPLQLKQVIFEDISSIQMSAFNKNQHISFEVPEDIEVVADQNMLNTVVRNLLQNAIKFTHDGGKIALKAEKNKDVVTISVKDTGIGIAHENLSKLFKIDEKFTNLGTHNEMGTGLGLILCKEFVERHNGKIWVESKEGKGSTFSFTIPLKVL